MTVVAGLDLSFSPSAVCNEPTFHGLGNGECTCKFRENVEGRGSPGLWSRLRFTKFPQQSLWDYSDGIVSLGYSLSRSFSVLIVHGHWTVKFEGLLNCKRLYY